MLGGLKNITFLISVEHAVIFKEGVRFTRNSIHLNFLEYFYEKKKRVRNAAAERENTSERIMCDWWGWGESMIIVYTLDLAGIFLLKKLSIL